MLRSKYKRGNIVKLSVKEADRFNLSTRDVIILGTYKTICGGSDHSNLFEYSFIVLDTGNIYSWVNEKDLTFVSTGGEHLIEEARDNELRIDVYKFLSGVSIEFAGNVDINNCFRLLGHYVVNSRIFDEWRLWWKKFDHIRKSDTIYDAQSIFEKSELYIYDIESVWKVSKGII